MTRIHYKASNVPYDGKFGEHEIDYILFLQKDVTLDVNENEVQSVQYLSKSGLQHFIGKLYTATYSSHYSRPVWFCIMVVMTLSLIKLK